MKKVLMIVYSLPPRKNPGAERAAIVVKLLHNYGWEPLVLTREEETGDSNELEAIMPRFLRAFVRFLASLLILDKERLWQLFSVREAVRMFKSKGVDLVYTVSPPSSAHLIGLRLKKKYPHIPWVADVCTSYDTPSLKELYEKKLLGKIANHADCVVTDNEAMLENFLTNQTNISRESNACIISEGHVQELSELFEKACRAIAARKLGSELK
jgi:hypothetical protein